MRALIKDIIIILFAVVAIALVFKPTIVKQHSMEPTLHENNYLFVNKLAYVAKSHPDYKDIIVFKSDDGTGEKMYIKRVIGVENDVITITGGKVYRNGEQLKEPYILENFTVGKINRYVVPEDEVFVMGDNRSISIDSRNSIIGSIKEDDIVGKAFFRLYPFNEMDVL